MGEPSSGTCPRDKFAQGLVVKGLEQVGTGAMLGRMAMMQGRVRVRNSVGPKFPKLPLEAISMVRDGTARTELVD